MSEGIEREDGNIAIMGPGGVAWLHPQQVPIVTSVGGCRMATTAEVYAASHPDEAKHKVEAYDASLRAEREPQKRFYEPEKPEEEKPFVKRGPGRPPNR